MTVQAVADLVGGRLLGSGDLVLARVRSLDRAGPGDLSLCVGRAYADALARSHAGAVLVPPTLAGLPGPGTRVVIDDPAGAMALATAAIHPPPPVSPGIASTARIGRGVTLGDGVSIGDYTVIGDGTTIGRRTRLAAHVVVEPGVTIGDDVRLDPHVTIHGGVVLGARVWCKASAVIGGTGFGFRSDADGHHRIPHVGGCVLEDDVEVGSHTSIDRGSLDDTRIGRGTRIDNQVQIAHNVQVGRDCLIMACVGIAGSTRLGDRVIMAGQSGCVDHIVVGDDVRIGAKSAVMADVAAGATVSGYPARPHRAFLRAVATMYRLAPLASTLERLGKAGSDGTAHSR